VPTAETSSLARSTHKPAYKRLTDDQRIAILHLAKTGKTQMQIAETLGCDQATVSRWLSQCQDSSLEATAYLKGSALRMARNIVERGLARDHVQALKGIKVLEDDSLQIPEQAE
jgi:transposase-like protein